MGESEVIGPGRGYWDPNLFLFLFPSRLPWCEQLGSSTCSHHLVLPHHGPNPWSQVVTDWHSDNHDPKSTFPFPKLISSGVFPSTESWVRAHLNSRVFMSGVPTWFKTGLGNSCGKVLSPCKSHRWVPLVGTHLRQVHPPCGRLI
jgi:hypothetical protein